MRLLLAPLLCCTLLSTAAQALTNTCKPVTAVMPAATSVYTKNLTYANLDAHLIVDVNSDKVRALSAIAGYSGDLSPTSDELQICGQERDGDAKCVPGTNNDNYGSEMRTVCVIR